MAWTTSCVTHHRRPPVATSGLTCSPLGTGTDGYGPALEPEFLPPRVETPVGALSTDSPGRFLRAQPPSGAPCPSRWLCGGQPWGSCLRLSSLPRAPEDTRKAPGFHCTGSLSSTTLGKLVLSTSLRFSARRLGTAGAVSTDSSCGGGGPGDRGQDALPGEAPALNAPRKDRLDLFRAASHPCGSLPVLPGRQHRPPQRGRLSRVSEPSRSLPWTFSPRPGRPRTRPGWRGGTPLGGTSVSKVRGHWQTPRDVSIL